jgi:hypothetical protein
MYDASEERVQCADCGEVAAMKDRMQDGLRGPVCPKCGSSAIVWADMQGIIERTRAAVRDGEL